MVAGTDGFFIAAPSDEDLAIAVEAWRNGQSRIELPQGSIWYRVISADSPVNVSRFATSCYASPALNRFSPVMAGGAIVPSAYAATSEATALWEVVLRDIRHSGARRIPVWATRDRYLCEVELNRPLLALDICRPRDVHLVVAGRRPPDLTAAWPSAYQTTRSWAQAIHDRLPGLNAICYESHQIAGKCVVVFDARDSTFELRGHPCRICDDPVRALVVQEALAAGAVIDFGDDDDEDS